MERIVHDLTQGSDEWLQFRLEHDGASEAAAMLGLSKNVKRNELLHMKHTGLPKEFNDWVQTHILDNGHAVEAMARPLVEALIGEELYPATYSYGRLSASCDGITMSSGTTFEHKQWNKDLAVMIAAGVLPDEHIPQAQQILLVTGAQRLIFVCSDGTSERFVHMEVLPDEAWWLRIVKGWAQFNEDLQTYTPGPEVVKHAPAPVKALPAITYQLNGLALTSNLAEYRKAAEQLVEESKKILKTDQDFADRDALNKEFKAAEERIEVVCEQVLGEIHDVDQFTRDLHYVGELIRQARLNGERQVEARKKEIRGEILQRGQDAWKAHIDGLNARLGKPYMPHVAVNFAEKMKGKRTITSLNDAVDTELARGKIEANAIADRIQVNLNTLRELAKDHIALFADTAQIVLKEPDDLTALVKLRIAEHEAAEEKRREQERERIRKEEADRLQREADERARTEANARQAAAPKPAEPAPAPAAATATPGISVTLAPGINVPIVPPTVAPAPSASTAAQPVVASGNVVPIKPTRPSDDDIIDVLSLHYRVHESKVLEWLLAMDLDAAGKRIGAQFA